MQLVLFKGTGLLLSSACALLALSACSDGSAGQAAAATTAKAPATAAASAQSYYLVTQVRPENPDKLFQRERGVHEMCVAGAKLKRIVAKPFPVLPPDFVLERHIYASDGKQTFYKEIQFKIDGAEVGQGCAYKISSTAHSVITRDGKSRQTEQDEQGGLSTGEEQPDIAEPVSQSKLDLYTETKVMKGVQLKCQGTACIVDPSLVVIGFGRRPVVAASRMDDISLFGTALITEPVSLAVGKPIDLLEFKQGSDK